MAEYRSTGRELRKSPSGVFAGLFLLALSIGGCLFVSKVLNNMVSLEPNVSEEVDLEIPDVSSADDSVNRIEYGSVSVSRDRVRRGPLMMINDNFPTKDAETGIVSVFEQKNEYLTTRDLQVYLMDEAMEALNHLAADYYEATGHSDLLIREGYVTEESQKQLYEADLRATGGTSDVPLPGFNEFESGYTFELSLFVNGTFQDFTGEGDSEWILRHCAEYGFIQRYPEDKTDYTHVYDQPSVFRYVGKPHAWYMYKNKYCLEEYTELLELHPYQGEHAIITDELGNEFEVYYVSVDPDSSDSEAIVPMPIGYQYTCTGNNKHGFYVTVDLQSGS